jgi:protease-4
MKIDPDILIDRMNLKRRITKWQFIAFLLVIVVLLALAGNSIDNRGGANCEDYIARIEIDGVIAEDNYRDEVIADILEDKNVKALIVEVNSPGGTTVGGEELYQQFKEISAAGKPVIIIMKTLATSAGYLIALGGDHIIARNGTLTGSIGVIVQSAEFTDLAEEFGVKFETFKSAPLKASPSPFEKTSPEVAAAIDSVVKDFYNYFVGLVASERNLPLEKAMELADGRIYTGSQALKLGLVDQIGGTNEALSWLKDNGVKEKLEIEDISVEEPQDPLSKLFFGDMKKTEIFAKLGLNGLIAIWYN